MTNSSPSWYHAQGWTGSVTLQGDVQQPENPGNRDPQILAMMGSWERIAMALASSSALRSRGARFIPQLPGEDAAGYDARTSKFVHVPWFEELSELAVHKLFRKTLNFQTEDQALQEWIEDVDGTGTDLEAFWKLVTKIAVQYGHCHVLTDMATDVVPRTLLEEQQLAVKPNLFVIRPEQVVGFRTKRVAGREQLTQFRYLEMAQVEDGRYGSKWVERVRVLEPGKFELWEKADNRAESWSLIEQGTYDLNEIPVSTVYGRREGVMVSSPPLLEVANINLLYDLALCDHSHQMSVAATPILVLKGFDEHQPDLTVSVNRALAMPPDGDVSYVQTDSASFQAQENYLGFLADRMNQVAIVGFKAQKNAAEAAAAKRMDHSDEDSALSTIATSVEVAVKQAVDWALQYMGNTAEYDLGIPDNLSDETLDPQEVAQLLALANSGVITKETLITTLVKGEVLDVDPVEEAELASQESLDDLVQNQEVMAAFASDPKEQPEPPSN